MKTKSHVRFLNRAAHFDADIELADVLKIAIGQGALNTKGNKYLFDYVNPPQHPRLASRANSRHNRILAVNHLKHTLCTSFLKDIYEDVIQYLLEILEAAARHGLDPDRLIGEHKVSIEANEILAAGNWPNVVRKVSESVFRRLESERSTKKLLQKLNTKLNLGVAQAKIDAALPYFEIRHLLVHCDGKADEAFCAAFPEFPAALGQKIALDHNVLQNACAAIFGLVAEFDKQVIAHNVVAQSELQP